MALPHLKTIDSYPEISMVFFFFLNTLKHSKIFVIQILYSYRNSSSKAKLSSANEWRMAKYRLHK